MSEGSTGLKPAVDRTNLKTLLVMRAAVIRPYLLAVCQQQTRAGEVHLEERGHHLVQITFKLPGFLLQMPLLTQHGLEPTTSG